MTMRSGGRRGRARRGSIDELTQGVGEESERGPCHIPAPYSVLPSQPVSDMIEWVFRRAIGRVEWQWSFGTSGIRDTIHASPRSAWMVSQVTHLLAGVALVGAVFIAAPAVAQVSDQPPAVSPYTFTPKRIAASGGAVVGLIGAVIGGLALARAAGRIGTGKGRRGAIVALVLGPIGLVIGGLVVTTADGGLGTGNGLAGGVVAMIVGLIGMGLGGLALARSRRIA
jgi:hypothetical protein